MSKEEWLSAEDCRQLREIERYASVRKMRLIAAAYVRRANPWDLPENVKQCDDLIEAIADRPRPWDEVQDEIFARPGESWQFTHILANDDLEWVAKRLRTLFSFYPTRPSSYGVSALRDVIGNLYCPVAFHPSWRTSDVMLLARGMYDDRAFDRMPILADALQDAGCDNNDILSHCRDSSLTHVRGCWVVDLVLRKS